MLRALVWNAANPLWLAVRSGRDHPKSETRLLNPFGFVQISRRSSDHHEPCKPKLRLLWPAQHQEAEIERDDSEGHPLFPTLVVLAQTWTRKHRQRRDW